METERALSVYRTALLVSAGMLFVAFFLTLFDLQVTQLSGLDCVRLYFGLSDLGVGGQFGGSSLRLLLPLAMPLQAAICFYRWARGKVDSGLADLVFCAVVWGYFLFSLGDDIRLLGVGFWVCVAGDLLPSLTYLANRRHLAELAEKQSGEEESFGEAADHAVGPVAREPGATAQVLNINGSLECGDCRRPVFPGEGLCPHCGIELVWRQRQKECNGVSEDSKGGTA